MKTKIIIIIQTILNFIALNVLLSRPIGNLMPNHAVSGILTIIYWGLVLLLSYGIAVRFKNKED